MIPGVPYDAEIDYLDTNGAAYVDTGIDSGDNVGFEVEATRINETTSDSVLFGTRHDTGDTRWFVGAQYNGMYYWGWNTRIDSQTLKLNEKHSFGLNFLNSRTCTFDGNLVGNITSTYQYGKRLYFCVYHTRDYDVSISSTNCWRIHGGKISVGNTIVRDFIPVRVGQTGYMYDRVSKRLFGNSGTGSFVLGPDVAKPVMGLYGMRQITYVPSDYVTDGIVAWYDGIWNIGWNKHDANAQTWKDLSGEGNDATIVKSDTFDRSFTFDSNSCTMDGTFCWSFTASNSVINAVKGDCTIEVIRLLGTPSIQDSTPFFGLNVYGSRAMSMSGVSSNMKFRMGMNDEFHTDNSTRPGISTTIIKHIEGTTVSTIFFEKGVQKGTGTYSTQAITVNSDGVLFGAGTNLFGGKGRYWNPSPPADGHAYTLRFYNRALSAAEIAHNYAIDKARFNLP